MDDISKVEYRVRDLPTRSVTLFPSRAQIVREIRDVSLKLGNNEIVVVGLSPTVDEHSIKVDGIGTNAIITNIAVELVPNRELARDVYPGYDDWDEINDDVESDRLQAEYDGYTSSEADLLDGDEEAQAEKRKVQKDLKIIRERLDKSEDDRVATDESTNSAAAQLKWLDAFGSTIGQKECNIPIENALAIYRSEREKAFSDRMAATIRNREAQNAIDQCIEEKERLTVRLEDLQGMIRKRTAKIRGARRKQQRKARLQRAEAKDEQWRSLKEREQFWPRSCYTVRLTLSSAAYTPCSSRGTSVTSTSQLSKITLEKERLSTPEEANEPTCDISLSYMTSSAFWSPTYDLALETTSGTARLCFDASVTNMTSESWTNCKITVSNSQATFSLQNNAIPALKSWHIQLGGKGHASSASCSASSAGNLGNKASSQTVINDIVDSREERAQRKGWATAQNAQPQMPRTQLFGADPGQRMEDLARLQHYTQDRGGPDLGASKTWDTKIHDKPEGYPPMDEYLNPFGPLPAPPPLAAASLPSDNDLLGGVTKQRTAAPTHMEDSHPNKDEESKEADEEADEVADEEADQATILDPTPELSFQESSFEETGLTTTYDLPGLKSLVPSSTASRQRLGVVSFTNVTFTRTVVAKYNPVAYLKARLTNSSRLALLKGPTGLTLDGTYIGRSELPRCSAGDYFSLSLGVDPAIKVLYLKPNVKRIASGMFSKEDSFVYTRTLTLLNSRATSDKHVNLTVLDQIPVSEDERLRVTTLHPRGMVMGGAAVMTGAAGRLGEKGWGRATSLLRKTGEVSWDVALNAGHSVKLILEYEVTLPAGGHVMQC